MPLPAPLRWKYRRYPALLTALQHRHEVYNETLSFLQKEEKAGTVLIIQPKAPVSVRRLETDRTKMEALYEEGYRDAERGFKKLFSFLGLAGTVR